MEYRKCVKIRVGVGKKAIFESCWLWRWHSEEKGMCGICLVPHGSDVVEGQQLAHTGHRDIPQHRASLPGHKVGEVVEGADHPSGRAGHQSEGAEQISGFSWGFPPSLSLSHSNSHSVRGVCCPAGGPSVAASVAVPAATAGPALDPGPCPGLSPDLIPDHPLPQSPTLPLGPGNPGTALTLHDL